MHIFISHCTEDDAFVKALRKNLEQRGLTVWVDSRNLRGGDSFIFDVPRLSVDIDLNYVGAEKCSAMLAERPRIEKAVQAVFEREGFTVRRMPEDCAGGKWSLC